MPSLFPGMDPYLEGSEWPSFHVNLGVEIARQLSPKVQPRYFALPHRRNVLDSEEVSLTETEDIYPDAAVVEAKRVAEQRVTALASASAATPAPLTLTTIVPVRLPLVWVEIRDVAERRLVTAIEILSPVNKHGKGRQDYLAKRERILVSTTHLLEIDLLRRGQRLPMREALPPAAYFVFLSRAGRRPKTGVWPIALSDALPTVPVPLLPEDADVTLDLQSALSRVYDDFAYHHILDYGKPPDVPLKGKDAEWAANVIQQAKSRA
jgi:hypothetical protein